MNLNQRVTFLFFLLAILSLVSHPIQAVINVTAIESGSTVVFTASGSANTSALSWWGGYSSGRLNASGSSFSTGASNAAGMMIRPITGPTNIGTTGTVNPPFIGSGHVVGIETGNMLVVPSGYVSGAALNGSATFTGTISSLGLVPGTYTWTWGSGANADSLILTISSPPIAITNATYDASTGVLGNL